MNSWRQPFIHLLVERTLSLSLSLSLSLPLSLFIQSYWSQAIIIIIRTIIIIIWTRRTRNDPKVMPPIYFHVKHGSLVGGPMA